MWSRSFFFGITYPDDGFFPVESHGAQAQPSRRSRRRSAVVVTLLEIWREGAPLDAPLNRPTASKSLLPSEYDAEL